MIPTFFFCIILLRISYNFLCYALMHCSQNYSQGYLKIIHINTMMNYIGCLYQNLPSSQMFTPDFPAISHICKFKYE